MHRTCVCRATIVESLVAVRDYLNHRRWEADVRRRVAPRAHNYQSKLLSERIWHPLTKGKPRVISDTEYRKSFFTEIPVPYAMFIFALVAYLVLCVILNILNAFFTPIEKKVQDIDKKRQFAESAMGRRTAAAKVRQ